MTQQTFEITYTKNGERFTAAIQALSREEAIQKLRENLRVRSRPASPKTKEIRLFIQGTHCASCEVLIERKFKKVAGVKDAKVNWRTGEAHVSWSGPSRPDPTILEETIRDKGYVVKPWEKKRQPKQGFLSHWSDRDFKEVGAVLLILFGGYLMLRQYDLIPKLAVTEGASYPFIFLVGLVAAGSSCLAVVGGLLISMAGLYSQETMAPAWKRFQPHILFNLGRLASYALLGGVIGILGKALSPSPQIAGFLMVLAAAFMVMTGLSMLNIIQKNPLLVSLPKSFQNAIHDASGSGKKKFSLPFLIGAATFFLPCGFTQSLQLYAMTTGSFEKGALVMFVFALGTMPALLGIGALSTFTKGTPFRLFLKFAGAFVLVLGVFNLNNGLTLSGFSPDILAAQILQKSVRSSSASVLDDPNVTFDGTRQIVSMKVYAGRYEPNRFTIRQGVPVEWHVTGVETGGCSGIITVPKYNIVSYIRPGPNVITFTPNEPGIVPFHCSMAMFRGQFNVVSDPNIKIEGSREEVGTSPQSIAIQEPCDALSGNCQVVQMEISREKGFYPRTFTVKKGVPVEWVIDDKIPLGGCMGTMVIPDYGVAQVLKIGENRIRFTPDREGTVAFTCSMGSKIGEFAVVN